jgi:hypothetical protein
MLKVAVDPTPRREDITGQPKQTKNTFKKKLENFLKKKIH